MKWSFAALDADEACREYPSVSVGNQSVLHSFTRSVAAALRAVDGVG